MVGGHIIAGRHIAAGRMIEVWFWRAASRAMIEAYELRMKAQAALSRFTLWHKLALAFTAPFAGGIGIGFLLKALHVL